MNGLKRHPFSCHVASFWRVWATRQMAFHTNKWRDWITKQDKCNTTKICFLTFFNTALTWENRPRIEDPFSGFGFQAASRDWSDTIVFFPCSGKDGEGKTLPRLALPGNCFSALLRVISLFRQEARVFSDLILGFFFLDLSKEWNNKDIEHHRPLPLGIFMIYYTATFITQEWT